MSEPPASSEASYPLDDAELERWCSSLNGIGGDVAVRQLVADVDMIASARGVDPGYALVLMLRHVAELEAAG